jgi:NADH:ubiquinone oxidoreductase subunit E
MIERTHDQLDRGLVAHVFVCTNDRDSEYACCADAHGDEVADAVRSWLRDRGALWDSVSVSTTSCLGLCSEDGTALTIQPRNEWYSDVTPEEVPGLLTDEFGPDAEALG